MFWRCREIKKNHNRYIELVNERFSLEEDETKREDTDKKSKEIDEFVENIYAKSIFEKYSIKRQKLVSNEDNQIVSWEQAFGYDFNRISKSLRHSLVGLIEGGGRYRLK